jgi:uncharacterized protein YdaU (DUF1376 family)
VPDPVSNFDHWMRFNVGDYLADTMHLSTFQHGLYVLLIMHYFKRGGLPEEEAALRLITKCPARQWRSQSPPVMSLFRRQMGTWRHPRIDDTIAQAKAVSEARAKAGKSGASARWGMANASHADGNCHSGLARARATEPETDSEGPPVAPQAGRRADGSNPRAQGTNPRATGDDPRSNGTNPRATGSNPRRRESRNAMIDIIREEMEEEAERHDESDARQRGAEVVPIARRFISGLDDP